jgi:hypothetical protein
MQKEVVKVQQRIFASAFDLQEGRCWNGLTRAEADGVNGAADAGSERSFL